MSTGDRADGAADDRQPAEVIERVGAGRTLVDWWPVDAVYHQANASDPRDEIVVGAVLVQSTAWQQVVRALERLKDARVLALDRIAALPMERLADLVRPAGFVRRKPATLQALARLVAAEGGMERLAEQVRDDPDPVRRLLLEVHGVGEETADAILNYALDAPVFVVDAYTRRLMARLGIMIRDAEGRPRDPLTAPYRLVQRWWMRGLARDAGALRHAHAAIVSHAQATCRRAPHCPVCPLQGDCPTAASA